MIDDGPGSGFRWTLFTGDAHGLYRQFGFIRPDETAMVRPSARATRTARHRARPPFPTQGRT